MESEVEKITILGDSCDYVKVLNRPLRNVTKMHLEFVNIEPPNVDPYVTVSFPDLSVDLPILYGDGQMLLYGGQSYPMVITEAHYHEFESPVAILRKLRIQIRDPSGTILPSSTFFMLLTMAFDNRLEVLPETRLKPFRVLRMLNFDASVNDGTNYDFKFTDLEPLRNVSQVRLLTLRLPPSSVHPLVIARFPELSLDIPMHYGYFANPNDVVLLKATDFHTLEISPPKDARNLAIQMRTPDNLAVLSKSDTYNAYEMYALVEIIYQPRSYLGASPD
jgi:hypothetical protein